MSNLRKAYCLLTHGTGHTQACPKLFNSLGFTGRDLILLDNYSLPSYNALVRSLHRA